MLCLMHLAYDECHAIFFLQKVHKVMQKLCITQLIWLTKSLGLTLKKIPLVMELFFVFMISSISLLHASGSYAQTAWISLDIKNQTEQAILEQVEAKSNFSFFYNNRHVDLNRK